MVRTHAGEDLTAVIAWVRRVLGAMDIDLAIEEQFFLLSSISLDLHLKMEFLNPFPLPFFNEENVVAYPDADAANALAGSVKIAEDSFEDSYKEWCDAFLL
nr:hypothetical protein [Tanacetum cinerariifolium]